MLDRFTAGLDKELAEKDQELMELRARVAEFDGLEEQLMERYGFNEEETVLEDPPTTEEFEENVVESVEGEPV